MIKFLTIFVLILITYSCKRYEDGPNFTLRTPIQRLSGYWEVTKFEIDGVDSLGLKPIHCGQYKITGKVRNGCYMCISSNPNCYGPNEIVPIAQEWYLSNDKERFIGQTSGLPLTVNVDYISATGDTTNINSYTWQIKKLTNKELLFERDVYSSETLYVNYRIEMRKIDAEW